MSARRVQLPAKLEPFATKQARYKVAYGGRGGAKSWTIARILLLLGAARKLRIGCFRELQLSIKDSVHKLLKEQIEALGLGSSYQVLQTEIRGYNGTEFLFAGLKSNATKIKSMEGLDIAWVEEAETVSDASWNVLIPTVRKEASEIWISFNPREDGDPTFQRFVQHPPDGAVVIKINWDDNPWFPDVLRKEKDYLYAQDVEAADHVWGGNTRRVSAAQILRGRWAVMPFEPPDDGSWSGPHFGVDWGFATDPTALVRLWIETIASEPVLRQRLYIEHEAYEVGVEIDHTPKLFDAVPEARSHVSRADNARPETISYLQRHGYPAMTAVEKWPGSVEDGIEHLRSYEQIVIHPRCVHAAEEARLWSWKVDKLTGDVLPVPVDKHNHVMDATRYALEPVIRSNAPQYEYQSASTTTAKKIASPLVGHSARRRLGGIL